MSDEIKPRIDEETGVGWCDWDCPYMDGERGYCGYDQRFSVGGEEVCPVHARRVAQDLKFQQHLNEETVTLDKLRAESAEARIAELEKDLAQVSAELADYEQGLTQQLAKDRKAEFESERDRLTYLYFLREFLAIQEYGSSDISASYCDLARRVREVTGV